ncbi:MAG: protein translocase subunit SecD [Parcubacteria group bacterium]|nr:protein translocase subunit SecD [Parcubacteria group bacterium]
MSENKKINILGWLDRCLKKFIYSIVRPTGRDKIRWVVIGLLVLAFLAGSLDYPAIWNKTADGVNFATSKVPALANQKVPYFAEMPFHLGLDLQGGTHLVYEANVSDVPEEDRENSLEGVRDVIERRVNAFGVAEPLVQTSKSGDMWRVIVELAGVRDISEAINMIGETPILEFKEQGTDVDAEPFELTEEQKVQMEEINTEAIDRTDEALARALAGDDWSALVEDYSQGMEKVKDSGDMGFIGSQLVHEPLASALRKSGIKNGEILNHIVETDEGLNVLKLLEANNKEVEARHILVCYEGAFKCESSLSEEDALEKITELKSQATAENFTDLARENSTEPGASESGGELGWFGRGMMVPAFEDTVFFQEVGSVSDVIKTDFGYHIILKTNERESSDINNTRYHVQRILLRTIKEKDFNPEAQYKKWKTTDLTGKQLKRAQIDFDPNTNETQVSLEFNDEGQKFFAEITERNVGKPVAIFLDGIPISIPTVQEPIRDGKAIITGTFDIEEAQILARRLNAGALPVPINLISQQSVGASLGQDSLEKSVKAGLIGFLLVIIFMIFYYRLPGLLAAMALILYGALILALFKLIPVTITLSGIAGFILSVGMAVDANVLIFERTKEELKRGKLLGRAIDEGFRRAWPSIRDGNLTTLLSCVILFWFSESMVKGFALTLGIGILVSLFSALVVTKVLLKFVAPWFKNTWIFGATKKENL